MNVLIHGKGLAGTWLAWELRRRGANVFMYDPHPDENASRVAAGLINPTTGSRPKSTWRSEVLMPFAQDAYRSVEAELGCSIWSPRTIRRVFLTARDASLWTLADQRGVGVEWSSLTGSSIDGVSLPYGGVEYRGATVDTNAFIDRIGALLEHEGRVVYALDDVPPADLTVWCHGWRASADPRWSWLPFQPVKGEILDATVGGPLLQSVYIRGIWIVPEIGYRGSEIGSPWHHVRIGSTHDWDDLTEQPTEHGRRTLVEKAQVILGREVHVTRQRAGVRPAAQSKRPYIGIHPDDPSHAIINGLGAKGSLWAPWAARQLADHVLDGKPLDEEVNIQRWRKD